MKKIILKIHITIFKLFNNYDVNNKYVFRWVKTILYPYLLQLQTQLKGVDLVIEAICKINGFGLLPKDVYNEIKTRLFRLKQKNIAYKICDIIITTYNKYLEKG